MFSSRFFFEYFLLPLEEYLIEIDRKDFFVYWKLILIKHQVRGKTKDISNLKVIYDKNGKGGFEAKYCTFWHGVKQLKFARSVTESEKIWMTTEIVNFLVQVNPKYKSASQIKNYK